MPCHLTGVTQDGPLQPPGTRRRTLTTFDREMMKIHERRATWLHRSCLRAIYFARDSRLVGCYSCGTAPDLHRLRLSALASGPVGTPPEGLRIRQILEVILTLACL